MDLRETPVVRFAEAGFETTAGHHPLDIVIVVPGFDAGTDVALAIDKRGILAYLGGFDIY